MSINHRQISMGISQRMPCSYLDDQQEQLLVIQDMVDAPLFERLLELGFRRSGDIIYKPRCPNCQACVPIRLNVDEFIPSTRQKRTLRNNQGLRWQLSHEIKDSYYPLYARYISQRHADGSMYPPCPDKFQQFIRCEWLEAHYLELYEHDTLLAVAVTDALPDSLSAIYTFFDPDEHKRSLGSLMILLQWQLCRQLGKHYLYLGYQIDAHSKMCYKTQYRPYQLLTDNGWQTSR